MKLKIEWNAVLSVVCAAALAVVAMSGWMLDAKAPDPAADAQVWDLPTRGLTLPTTIDDDLTVNGDVITSGDVTVGDDLAVTGDIAASADFTVGDALTVTGAVDLGDALEIDGALTLPVNTEHIGAMSVITASVTHTPVTGTVASIGANEVWLIHAVYVQVTSNFDCTGDNCTLQIGDGGDANGLVDLVDAELQAAAVDVTGAAAGWMGFMSDTRGAYLADGSAFVYAPSAAETIDFAVGGTDPAAGAATVYVVYTRIK